MIIPRYDQWSKLELQAGESHIKWSINSTYGRYSASPVDVRIYRALLALIRAERARRSS